MKNRAVLAMVLFIASETIFFLMLVLAYVSFHKTTGTTAAAMLDPIKTGLFSIALFSSSLTMWLAEVSRKKAIALATVGTAPSAASRLIVGVWLFLTLVLGGIFLTGQGLEYANLLTHHVTISRDLFGSSFFTLTGFHGFHVFVGLVFILLLLCLVVFGRKHEPELGGMQSIALYWHFVDLVWIVIYSVVYLWRYV